MDLGENGNRANSGQKLTKMDGNQEIIRVVSPNSDMVCGIPQKTKSIQMIVDWKLELSWKWKVKLNHVSDKFKFNLVQTIKRQLVKLNFDKTTV